jgi:hypothetical protein
VKNHILYKDFLPVHLLDKIYSVRLTPSWGTISVPGNPPAGPPCPWAPGVCQALRPEWLWCSRASGPARQPHSDTSARLAPVSAPPADHLASPKELSWMWHRSLGGDSLRVNTIEQSSQAFLACQNYWETFKNKPVLRQHLRTQTQNFLGLCINIGNFERIPQ